MCGICGEFRFDGSKPDNQSIRKMMTKLESRGPDSAGEFASQSIALGHRRLSIIDLSEKSNQPMIDKELGLTLVFNGTIYNYPSLRKSLIEKGYHFSSTGDSEVIIKAFHQWGVDCVNHLHGMFAFAIWSEKNRQLFVARDRVGIKPLYYSLNHHRLIFASNTQALLTQKDINKDIDPVSLHHQLTLHAVIPAPGTILQGIKKVKPAHWMLFNENGLVSEKRYWELTAQRPEQAKSEAQWMEEIHHALHNAVIKRNEIADVPVGVLLSGGIDSCLLVALLAEGGCEDLRTFTIGFEDTAEEMGNEFVYSDAVVERYQTKHSKFLIPNSQVLSRLPEAVEKMSEPMVAQDAVAFYLLSEQVSKQVKVVQSGQRADEVFAGYFWYPKMHHSTGDEFQRFRDNYFDRDHEEYLQTVTPQFYGEDYTEQVIRSLLDKPGADTMLDKVLRMDVTTLIVDDPVKRVDNMTMAWGLESRVPFLDHQLIELAMQMPPELKLKQNGKHPLKVIAKKLLPSSVIDRPKGYFPMPALKYVRGEFLEFMKDILSSESCRQRKIFDQSYINKILTAPDQYHTRLNGSKLWHMALLELWFQINV